MAAGDDYPARVSETVTLRRPPGLIHASLQPPGSKSLSNRAILLAAMAEGRTRIEGCLDADDTRRMLDCLGRLGIELRHLGATLAEGLEIDGDPRLGRVDGELTLEVGTAGTVARFLTAALAAAVSPRWAAVLVDGSARMRERPMESLLEALIELGARLEFLGQPGALPVRVLAGTGLGGGRIVLERPASSQFVSALLLAGCLAREPVHIELREGTPSRPYVDMTLALIETFGGAARWVSDGVELVVEPRPLRGVERYVVEPDASAASYLLALPAIWGGEVTIPALGRASLQGDAGFAEVLARFGAVVEQSQDRTCVRGAAALSGTAALRGVELDLTDMPDVALTAAVVALFADGPTRIHGVEILRHHESDRLTAGATELRKLGATVIEREGGLEIYPPKGGPKPGVVIDTYLDHRMAMAFSLVGDVVIADPRCVDKTFPDYYDVLARLGMVVT
jgi:3-phosphoshikimate 1-carboxyvinyltransferase